MSGTVGIPTVHGREEVNEITPGERRTLCAVVRQQMKVLRAEVKQRRGELIAAAEARLVEKYRDEDRLADELASRIAKIAADANRDLQFLLGEYAQITDGRWKSYSGFGIPSVTRVAGDRKQLREALIAGINSQVEQAQLALDRQEADLLRDLSVASLESQAAREFLSRIPAVADLVPAVRLREIEAQFDGGIA